MSPKKSPGKKAAETRKRRPTAKKAAAKRKHPAAGIKAAAQFDHHEAGKKAALTKAKKKQAVAPAPVEGPAPPETASQVPATEKPSAEVEELPAPTPETSVTQAETSKPIAAPTRGLKAAIEDLRNAKWGRR